MSTHPDPDLNPGDEAEPGTPGAGEDVCEACAGSGKLSDGKPCANCGGSGKVTGANAFFDETALPNTGPFENPLIGCI